MRYALEYIQNFCCNIRDSKSKTVHNMAFYFHSRIDYSTDGSKRNQFIKFLEKKEDDKSKGRPIYFEVDYALNICKQNEKELIQKAQTLEMEMRSSEVQGVDDDEHQEEKEDDQQKLVALADRMFVMK